MSVFSTIGKWLGGAAQVAGNVIGIANPALGAGISGAGALLGAGSKDYENESSQNAASAANQRNFETNLAFTKEQNQLQRDFNAAEAEKSRAFNAAQSQLQFERNLEAWNKQNEYNTPAAQIQRLKDAGINPNMYGSDGNTASLASPSAAASSSPASSAALGAPSANAMGAVSHTNLAFEAAQTRLANSQAENLEAKTKTENVTRDGIVRLNDMQYKLWSSEIPVNDANAKYLSQAATKMDAERQSILKGIVLMGKQEKLLDDQHNLNQKEIDAFADKLHAYFVKAAAETNLALANANAVASQIALNYANAQKAVAEGNLANAQADSYALSNFLDGCKLNFWKESQSFLAEFTSDSVITDWISASNSRAGAKRGAIEEKADAKMWKYMDNDIIAFLRAFASFINFNAGANISNKSAHSSR